MINIITGMSRSTGRNWNWSVDRWELLLRLPLLRVITILGSVLAGFALIKIMEPWFFKGVSCSILVLLLMNGKRTAST
jgi:hypothetical protein